MEMKILKERDTPLLSRKRYTLEIDSKGATPSRKEIRDLVAAKLKADEELTIIKHVYPRYGVQKVRVIAHVYEKKEDMIKNENKGLIEKHKKEEKKEAEEEKPEAEEKSEEKTEEKNEEKKEEKEEKTEEREENKEEEKKE